MQQSDLTTPRLFLRLLQDTDDEAIFSLRSSEEVNKFIDRPRAASIEEARTFINKIRGGIAEGKSFYWGITLKNEPGLIGTICIWNLSADGRTAELGYELSPSFQGRGIMQEAISKVIEFAFTTIGLSELEAFTHKDNNPSTNLLLKHGFAHQPERKDPDVENNAIYTLRKPNL